MSTGGEKARSGKVNAIGPRICTSVLVKFQYTVKASVLAAHCGVAYSSSAAR